MTIRLLLAALGLALSIAAQAAGDPCAADKRKFCPDATGSNVGECLMQHGQELSPACQSGWKSYMAGGGYEQGEEDERNGKRLRKKEKKGGKGEKPVGTSACLADLKKFCGKVKLGNGRLVDCLHENESELSKGCRKAHSEHYRKMEMGPDAKGSCAGDAEDFCADVTPGTGRLARCLKENLSELSKPCTKVVKGGRDKLEKQMGESMAGAKAAPAGGESD